MPGVIPIGLAWLYVAGGMKEWESVWCHSYRPCLALCRWQYERVGEGLVSFPGLAWFFVAGGMKECLVSFL